jgi:hypothetical protein
MTACPLDRCDSEICKKHIMTLFIPKFKLRGEFFVDVPCHCLVRARALKRLLPLFVTRRKTTTKRFDLDTSVLQSRVSSASTFPDTLR